MDCLVDTSVWIDFFNGTITPEVEQLKRLLSQGNVATTPVIVMEIIQGIGQEQTCQQILSHFANLSQYPIADERYIEAAQLYRQLRKQGVNIGKSIDWLIAAVALHFRLPVLHRDRDFSHIASHTDLICYSVDKH